MSKAEKILCSTTNGENLTFITALCSFTNVLCVIKQQANILLFLIITAKDIFAFIDTNSQIHSLYLQFRLYLVHWHYAEQVLWISNHSIPFGLCAL